MNPRVVQSLLKIARAACPTNKALRTAHVAFLLKKNRIAHIGWNKRKTHPQILKYPYRDGQGIHAELDVILKSGEEDLSNFSLVVVRFDRSGKIANSKPCRGCRSLLNQLSVKKVWYSNNNGDLVAEE